MLVIKLFGIWSWIKDLFKCREYESEEEWMDNQW